MQTNLRFVIFTKETFEQARKKIEAEEKHVLQVQAEKKRYDILQQLDTCIKAIETVYRNDHQKIYPSAFIGMLGLGMAKKESQYSGLNRMAGVVGLLALSFSLMAWYDKKHHTFLALPKEVRKTLNEIAQKFHTQFSKHSDLAKIKTFLENKKNELSNVLLEQNNIHLRK